MLVRHYLTILQFLFIRHFRYIGTPEPDQTCPVIVRKTIDSLVYANNMMDFIKPLGLRSVVDFRIYSRNRIQADRL
jgi:hypothetical protein